MLRRIADITWERPKLVLAAAAILAVLAGGISRDLEEHLNAAGFTDSASESERATALLRAELGYDANPGLVVLVRDPHGGRLDLRDVRVRREVDRIAAALAQAEHVGRVRRPILAPDRRAAVIPAHLATQDAEADGGEAVDDAKRRIGGSPLDVGLGGFAASFSDTNEQVRGDLVRAELIAFPLLALLLLFVFRSVVAASVPLLIGVLSILGTFLMLRLTASFLDTSLFAQNIATGLSLGLSIDYALLLVSRYREELDASGPTREAHRTTVMTAGRTVLFSGFTVAAALAGLIVFPQRFLYSLAVAGALTGVIAALVAVILVPSLLALLGSRINALSIRGGPSVSANSGAWYRLARAVMRRPVMVALGTSAVLLAAAVPLASTNLTGPSAQAVPPSQPSYAVNRAIEASFGRGVTEAVTVTITGRATDTQLAQLQRQIAAIDGIREAGPFDRASQRTVYANLALQAPALDERSQAVVEQIRATDPPGTARVLVSGNTARFIDQKQSLLDHLPLVVPIVAATTLVLLFLLTGSVLLPVKTLIMNTITLGATLGILVLAFQHGWLTGPLDYAGPPAVEVTTLVFLFAIVFGLATDYAVLVMARIKEHHDRGASNEEAVAAGIGQTGRVITAAAVMIAVVLGAFAVSPVFFMKQLAVGESVGVLIDAMIVRALLVPSLMRLFGEWNWWAPAPLARIHRRLRFQAA